MTPDRAGDWVAQLIVNDGKIDSDPDTALVKVTAANQPPTINSTPDTTATAGQPYSYQVTATDPDAGDTLTYSLLTRPEGMTIGATTGLIQWTPTESQVGGHSVRVRVTDRGELFDEQNFVVTVEEAPPTNQAPQVTAVATPPAITLPTNSVALDGTVTDDGLPSPSTLTYTWSGPNAVTFGDASAVDTTATFSAAGTYTLTLTASDGQLSGSATVTVTVNPEEPLPTLPPDPATVAPPVDPTVATTTYAATEFLYTGSNPIQTGVAAGTIEAKRVAVIRGQVLNRANQPLPGVRITILNHPEFGQTLSRADGAFDLAVNGGGALTLVYERAGYLPAQRQVQTPWQDYVFAPDVSLVTLDPAVTTVNLGASGPIQVARGSASTDGDGTRQATLLFPANTTAAMVLPNGTTQPLTTLNVRTTEYTIGPDGPKAMPAELPPTSGYTYAVEITADEALAASAVSVTLSQPIPFYVENFLGFPVGTPVPVGYYDRQKGQWIAAPNGRVIQVTGITADLADLDVTGDGAADPAETLAALGVTEAERARLAVLYSVGQSLWRVPLEHFTPWDCNWPYGPPDGAEAPTGAEAEAEEQETKDDPNEKCGSIIACETQTLGEAIPVTGTPFSLHYQSERTPGYAARRSLKVDLTEAVVPSGVKRVKLAVSVTGKRYEQTFAPTPNQRFAWTWDGLDAFGRAVQGKQKATVTVSYDYDAVYYASRTDFEQSFALASGVPTTITRQGSEIGLEQTSSLDLGSGGPDGEPVAGWSLSAHHRWDAARGMLVRGDGSETRADAFGAVITTVAGTGFGGFSGDGGPATAARLYRVPGAAVGADGSLYIADMDNHRIRRVGPDAIISTVAGNGGLGFSGDGGVATAARLHYPYSVAIAPDGSLYIADYYNYRIRRVAPDGIITTVAGNGAAGFSGDGGPAISAKLWLPSGVVIADGSLYIADPYNHRVRRVAPDGIITTVAGNGASSFSGDGGPATAASLNNPYGVAVGADGALYIADYLNNRIRRVGPEGVITTVAGNGVAGFSGDGGPATAASLTQPIGVAITNEGVLFIADSYNHRIRKVDPSGTITTVVGNGVFSSTGDGGPAMAASLNAPYDVAVAGDGNLYIAEVDGYRIRRVTSTTGFQSLFVPSADGSEVYEFDLDGRHLRTLDALTSGTLYSFGYNANGRLISVTDGSGNVTRIERDGAGNPTAIVSPYGQPTELTLNGNGYLATITNPAGETYRMQYTDDGLLTRFEDPRGNASTMSYDPLGRLTRDANAAGGSQSLANVKLEDPPGTRVTVTTAEGAATAYRVEDLPIGDQRRTVTQPDGTATLSVTGTDGKTTTTGPDGTLSTLVRGPDPRFGMSAPVSTSQTVTTPGGLVSSLVQARAATLTTPNDPLTLVTLTDTVTTNGRRATSVYQAASRTTTRTSAASRQSTTVLDTLGRPTLTQTAGLAPVAYTYDARGRLDTVTQGAGPDARTVSFGYDAAGYLGSITDALGRSAGFAYDAAGRVERQTFPDGRAVLFDYDAKGNLTALTPPGRPAHAFTYTPVDLTAEYIPPNVGAGSNSTQYSYNRDKQLTNVTRPDGKTVALGYDPAGRLATLTVPEGVFNYAYHATSGNLSQITAPGGGLSFSYDGSLLTGATWTGEIAGSVGFAYDNDFRIASVAVNGANPVTYAYDPDSLLTGAGGLSLSRNPQNGLLMGSTLGVVADTWNYNGFGEPASYTANQGSAPLLSVTYTRDALGRITDKTETVGGVMATYAYGYDLAGRLVEVKKDGAVQTTWGYDDNGNRTRVNGAEIAHYDNQDRLLDYAGATYTYTANGELLTKTAGADITGYDYDVLGNLRQVTLPNGTVIAYLTDGRNRRIGKKVGNALVQGFLYQDQLKPVAELDSAGNFVSRFVYATRVNVPDYLIKGGVTYRIVTDHLGSPRLVVNAADGTVAQRMDYDAWGNVLLDTNPGFQPFGFAGGLYDRDTGLMRFGARDYDAGVGRWMRKDPTRFSGADTNFYRYAAGDPVNFLDQEGRVVAAAVVVGAAGGAVLFVGSAVVAAIIVDQIYRGIRDYWDQSKPDINDTPIDGDGNPCPIGNLAPTGDIVRTPATNRNARGGVQEEEVYVDQNGKPVTKQTVYDKNGKPIHGNYRPGGPKDVPL